MVLERECGACSGGLAVYYGGDCGVLCVLVGVVWTIVE